MRALILLFVALLSFQLFSGLLATNIASVSSNSTTGLLSDGYTSGLPPDSLLNNTAGATAFSLYASSCSNRETWNNATQACDCVATAFRSTDTDSCVCPVGASFDAASMQCKCPGDMTVVDQMCRSVSASGTSGTAPASGMASGDSTGPSASSAFSSTDWSAVEVDVLADMLSDLGVSNLAGFGIGPDSMPGAVIAGVMVDLGISYQDVRSNGGGGGGGQAGNNVSQDAIASLSDASQQAGPGGPGGSTNSTMPDGSLGDNSTLELVL